MANVGFATLSVIPSLRGLDKSVTSQLGGPLATAGRAAGQRTSEGFASSFANGVSSAARSVGRTLQAGLTIGAVGAGAFAATAFAKGFGRLTTIENATSSLTVQLGDAGKAARLLDQVLGVVKGTPFNLDQFADAAANLVSMGVEAQKVPGYLTAIGEASATKGKRANEFAARLASVFGTVSAQGRIMGGDINEIAAAGVNALAILANHFGVTGDEMRDMVSEGAIPATVALDVLADGIVNGSTGIAGATVALGGTMAGLRKTLTGSIGGLGAATARLGAAFLTPFSAGMASAFGSATDLIDKLTPRISAFAETIANSAGFRKFTEFITGIPDRIEKAIGAFKGVAAAVGPLVGLLAGLASTSLSGLLGPLGALVPALGPLQGALIGLVAASPPLRDALGDIAKAAKPLLDTFGELASTVVEALVPVISQLVSALVPILPPIVEAFTQVADAVGGAVVEAFEALAPAAVSLVSALTPILPVIGELAAELITGLAPVLPQLAEAFAELVVAVIPLIPPLLQLATVFTDVFIKVAIPVLSAFAAGVATAASVLASFPAPVLAAAAALGALALAYRSLMAGGVIFKSISAVSGFLASLNPVTAALIVTAAAVTALGFVMKAFGKDADNTKKISEELGSVLTLAADGSSVFKDGISSATEALRSFLRAQIEAGDADFLKAILLSTGQSVDTLSTHLGDGAREWDAYAAASAESTAAVSGLSPEMVEFLGLSDKVVDTLNDQREAFIDRTRAVISSAEASGDLTKAQVAQLTAQNRNVDGTVNYGRLLDDVNAKLHLIATETDRANLATAKSSPVYADMSRQLASGKLSADKFADSLKNKFTLSAGGAKDATELLADEVKALADEVNQSFPSVADAAKDLTNDVSGIANDVVSRTELFSRQMKLMSAAGSSATEEMRDNVADNLREIRNDFKVLVENTDPQKFTENLIKQVQNIATFFANVQILVRLGASDLARQMLQLGPQVGGNLAAGFAAAPTKAKVANAALGVLDDTKGEMQQWVLAHFPELSGIGGEIPKGVAAGIDANTGAATGAATRMGNAVKGVLHGQFRISSPSKWARDEVGKPIVAGLAEGLDGRPIDRHLKKLVTRIQDGLSKPIGAAVGPLTIGAEFKPARQPFVSDTRVSDLAATRAFSPGPPVVLQVSGNNIFGLNDLDRHLIEMLRQYSERNPHHPIVR